MIKINALALCAFLIAGCSSYVNQWRNKIDEIEAKKSNRHRGTSFNQRYRNKGESASPRPRRNYRSSRRVTVSGLYDNKNENSLWAGQGNENYLFTRNNAKRRGDIIIIDMGENLKREIIMELSSRSIPMFDKSRPENLKKNSQFGPGSTHPEQKYSRSSL